MAAALCAPGKQASVLEEHVDELPQHVVRRLDQLLTDVGVFDRGLELPLRARRRERDRQGSELARERYPLRGRAAVRLGSERDRDVLRAHEQLDLRRQRVVAHCDRRQRTLADDHRMNELDRDVARVRARGGRAAEGHQPPAPREPLRHQMAEAGEPLSLRAEELTVGLASSVDRRLAGGIYATRRRGPAHASALSRWATDTSHSRQASTPSPVRALTSIRSTPG